jgi:hypothetical protein
MQAGAPKPRPMNPRTDGGSPKGESRDPKENRRPKTEGMPGIQELRKMQMIKPSCNQKTAASPGLILKISGTIGQASSLPRADRLAQSQPRIARATVRQRSSLLVHLALFVAVFYSGYENGLPAGTVFDLEGDATISGYGNESRPPTRQATFHFHATLDLPRWKIRAVRLDEPEIAYHEAGTDHQGEIYSLMAYSDAAVERMRSGREETMKSHPHLPNPEIQLATARIVSGTYPFAVTDPVLRVLWFTFASPAHLDSLPEGLIQPYFEFETTPEFLASAVIARRPSPPNLPESAVIFSDGLIRATSFRPNERRLAPPYDQGFRNAEYQVKQWTNYHGMSFPLAADIAVYAPGGQRASSNDVRMLTTWTIRVTNVSHSASALSLAPQLPGLAFISDERFRSDGLAQVRYTNTSWPAVTSVVASAEFEYVKKFTESMKREKQQNVSRTAVLFALLIVSSPFAYVCVRLLRGKQRS